MCRLKEILLLGSTTHQGKRMLTSGIEHHIAVFRKGGLFILGMGADGLGLNKARGIPVLAGGVSSKRLASLLE